MSADCMKSCITVKTDPRKEGDYLATFQTDHACIMECRSDVQYELEALFKPVMLRPGRVTICLRGYARSSSVVVMLLMVRLLVKLRVPKIEMCCEHRNTADLVRNIRIDAISDGLLDLIKPCSDCELDLQSHIKVHHQH